MRGAQPSGPSSWGVGGPILPFGPQLSKESLQNRESEFQSARVLSWRLKSTGTELKAFWPGGMPVVLLFIMSAIVPFNEAAILQRH